MRTDPGGTVASRAELQAATFAGLLWTAIDVTGGPRPATLQPWHFPRAYEPGWLATLPLPIGANRPAGQPVALLDERDEFDRHCDGVALRHAYVGRPRTRVYESINRDADDAWYSLAACHLGRLAHCALQVVCSVFESRHGDESLGEHWDAWYGAIVQMYGVKVWQIGENLLGDTKQPARELITEAGDILLLPKRLPHAVSTPQQPGNSVHLAFAIDRD
jgi:Cupin superfamily protein